MDDIIAISDKISGLVIEFHDLDKYIKQVEAFVNAFPLTLAHTHAVNCGPIYNGNQPKVVELTFTSQSYDPKPVILPHILDRPNRSLSKGKLREEYYITFK